MTGALCEIITSQPFGDNVQKSTPSGSTSCYPTPQFFTGKERDSESNLDDFGARYFSSQWGRWMSPDWSASPSAVPYATLTSPQSLNLYAYAGNDPIDGEDADGHATYFFGNGLNDGSDAPEIMEQQAEQQERSQDDQLQNAVDLTWGTARGIASSMTGGLIGSPSASDSNASLAGQLLGTSIVGGTGTEAISASGPTALLGLAAAPETGGASLVVSGAAVATGLAGAGMVAGAAKNGIAIAAAVAQKGGGETSATKAGRDAHKNYDPGPGFEKEVRLPSGKRADAVNKGAKQVNELKPNNSRAVARGKRQVEGYRQELQNSSRRELEIKGRYILMKNTPIIHIFNDGLYSVAYPNNWKLSEEEGNVSVADDNDLIAINITSFKGDRAKVNMAASYHLNRFLSRPEYEAVEIEILGSDRSKGSCIDQERRIWKVIFESHQSHLLLATLNASHDTPNDLLTTGECILDSVRLLEY